MIRVGRVAPLVFVSGACALVYQVAWLKEMQLIFGASTAASAAVLAIFMGGLGAGGLVLGKRVDDKKSPLAFYAALEGSIAIATAATPFLVDIARHAYLATGGSVSLGTTGATAVRLLLATLVLALPTFLMGGTLPAAARAVTRPDDTSRRTVATLYGANTLGAVVGALVTNFLFLEVFGTRLTLWLWCLVNLLIAVVARALARTGDVAAPRDEPEARAPSSAVPGHGPTPPPAWFPPLAAAVVGFCFFLMELVWYRMLAPLLGGSSYTFGLILAVALLGIGLGGGLYALSGRSRSASLGAFAVTCALEALFVAFPYALGDRVATLALLLRPLGALGFSGHVMAWTLVASILVLPAAIVSGFQFPLLIGLFGAGDQKLGRHVGWAYAANTGGAILGSLAGGFGVIAALGAEGCWRVDVAILCALGAVSAALAVQLDGRYIRPIFSFAAAALALVLLRTEGPTAAWRHSPIGAGRMDDRAERFTGSSLVAWRRSTRASIVWSADGKESSVALSASDGYAFLVNGKMDGSALSDASTQVLSGLIGVALVPDAKRALVVGLGTGSTAGWLGAVPSMERVDVVELEPKIVEVARACAPVNRNALDNPKVHVHFGDAREALLVGKDRYDVVFSEPSNPYRAGISSLYTEEFYRAVLGRLSPNGVFVQWLQTYEIDGPALRTALATIGSVFPHVTIWQTARGDLMLVASHVSPRLDEETRKRVESEPIRSAMIAVWGVEDFAGFLAHFIADEPLVRQVTDLEGVDARNTDDRNLLEYAFARNVGKNEVSLADDLVRLAHAAGLDRPRVDGSVDWSRVASRKLLGAIRDRGAPPGALDAAEGGELAILAAYAEGDLRRVVALADTYAPTAEAPDEWTVLAESYADLGRDEALPYLERVRTVSPTTAKAIEARLIYRRGFPLDAALALEEAFVTFRDDPWASSEVMDRALRLALPLADHDRYAARRLRDALAQPFSVHAKDDLRKWTRVQLAKRARTRNGCLAPLHDYEPEFPWDEALLRDRARCYAANDDPLAKHAERELLAFLAGRTASVLGEMLAPNVASVAPARRSGGQAPLPHSSASP